MRFQKFLECDKHGKVRHYPVGDIYVCGSCIREKPKISLDEVTTDTKKVKKEVKSSSVEVKSKVTHAEPKPFKFGERYKPVDVPYWREFFRDRFQKKTTYLIFMYLRNGLLTQFKVSLGKGKELFSYDGGTYHINPDMAVYDVHSKMMCLVYNQDVSEPFKIDFNLEELRKSIDNAKLSNLNISDVKKALNPYSLMAFIESKVIEKVIQGGQLEQNLKTIKLLIIVNLIITAIVGVVVAKGMGYI